MRIDLFPSMGGWGAGVLALAIAVSFASCDRLTDIAAPDALTEESLNNPEGALALRNGAISRFYGQMNSGGVFSYSGLLTDELVSGEFALRTEIDARRVTEFGGETGWAPLHEARIALHIANMAMRAWRATERARIGELFAFEGFTVVWVGEAFCSGAPFSEPVESHPVDGDPLTTSQIFERALEHYDSALAYADDDARVLNLARVGRGRALLNLGRFADAAQAVAAVPTEYVFQSEHSASAQPNTLFSGGTIARGVADREGGNGLDFVSAGDPRVPTELANVGSDGVTPMFRFMPFSAVNSPVTIASGREARLIEAEYAMQRGDPEAWLALLNQLRAAFDPALPPLADPGSEPERVDLMFRERAFWMYMTGHRLGDLRRLIRQYDRAPDSVFPTGFYKDDLPYGTATHLTIQFSETRNPKFTGCDSSAP